MSSETVIDQDLPCNRCAYNLRGLTVVHRCPECQHPALRAYIQQVAGRRGWWNQLPDGKCLVDERKATDLLASLLGCQTNTIRFVRTAAVHAARTSGTRAGSASHVSARQVCDAVRAVALTHFGGETEAQAGLRALGLTRSEDVGRIIAALVEAGFLDASEEDSPSDFKGLFTLDTLFGQTDPE